MGIKPHRLRITFWFPKDGQETTPLSVYYCREWIADWYLFPILYRHCGVSKHTHVNIYLRDMASWPRGGRKLPAMTSRWRRYCRGDWILGADLCNGGLLIPEDQDPSDTQVPEWTFMNDITDKSDPVQTKESIRFGVTIRQETIGSVGLRRDRS